jgi:hypothetical protein
MIATLIFTAALAAFVLACVARANGLMHLESEIRGLRADMEVVLEDRDEFLDRVVNRGVDRDLDLTRIDNLRRASAQARTLQERARQEILLGQAVATYFAMPQANRETTESEASSRLADVRDTLNDLEHRLHLLSIRHNEVVARFNNRLDAYPGPLVGMIFGYTRYRTFDLSPREDGDPGEVAAD